jgi:hypothetical protein
MVSDTARGALAGPWFDRFARVGYVTKGMVFLIVGILAVRVALGERGAQADVPGALAEVGNQPLQAVLLVLLALGLTGYAIWRIVQGVADLEKEGSSVSGWAKRLGYVGVGLIYGGFAVYSVGILTGWVTENDDNGEIRDLTALVMGWPGGRWLVAAAGTGIIVAGLVEVYFAISRRFEVELGRDDLGTFERTWLVCTGGVGHLMRGAVYCVVGFFAIRAAAEFDPDEARGLAESLRELATQPFGPWLVGAAASGFIAFGLYCGLLAIHRHVPNEGLIRGRGGGHDRDVAR